MTAGLAISGVTVTATRTAVPVVDDVSIAVARGQLVGLVGESGSGKTTLGRVALGDVRSGFALQGGSVRVRDAALTGLDRDALRLARAGRISWVAQHPAAVLNPALRIRTQLDAVLRAHTGSPRPDQERLDQERLDQERIDTVAEAVELPAALLSRYPHELSGGQLQRAALAIALVVGPDVVVLDEPTTGLDEQATANVFAAIRRSCTDRGLAVLCITHDLALAARVADRLCVMYAGSVVEEGPTAAILDRPAHPYTRHLVASLPDPTGRRPIVGLPGRGPDHDPSGGCRFAPRCGLVREACLADLPPLAEAGDRTVRCVRPFEVPPSLREVVPVPGATRRRAPDVLLSLRDVSASHPGTEVLRAANLDVGRGEWLAVIGPSGAGKTTLLRVVAGLHPQDTGTIELAGAPLAAAVRARTRRQRLDLQLVLQQPHAAFNPRRTVGQAVERPLRLAGASRAVATDAVAAVLDRVGLHQRAARCYPDQLSGGELQRAAIARAIVGRPRLLLCDEITSSLDTIVQANLLEVLRSLRDEDGLAIVFVTHDLALAAATADRTVVLTRGAVVAP